MNKTTRFVHFARAAMCTASAAARRLVTRPYADFRGVFTYRDFIEMRRFAKDQILSGAHREVLDDIIFGKTTEALPLP